MSRPAQLTKAKTLILAAVIALLGVGVVADVVVHDQASKPPASVSSKPAPTTQVSYRGEEGKTALELLKQHAKVTTKTSTGLGEFVTAVNGNDGGGKKYWIYYVNGQEAQVGAGAYTTHASDVVTWKLQ